MPFLRSLRTNNRIKEFWMLSATFGGGAMVYRKGNMHYTSEAVKQKILALPEHELQSSYRQEQLTTVTKAQGLLATEMGKYKWTSKFVDLMNYELTAKFITRLPKT